MLELESGSPEDTERIGARLAGELEAGDVVLVSGDLGSGKTTLVRGACRALGVTTAVTSPTYAIGHRYTGPTDVAHLDLYRFETVGEADWADLEPYFEGTIAFVEWPAAAEPFLPRPRLRVRLRLLDPQRRLVEVHEAGKPLQMTALGP